MAIPSTGNIEFDGDVGAEFGTLTKPDPFGLWEALLDIFGSGSTEDQLTDFAGLSRPEGEDTTAATNVSATSATLNGAFTDSGGGGALQGWYYFEYDTSNTFPSPSYTSTQTWTGGSISPSANITGLTAETIYYYRIRGYNAFNSYTGAQGTAEHNTGDTVSFETTSSCADPTDFTAVWDGFDSVQLDWNSSYSPSDGWEIQYQIDGGNWNVAVDDLSGTFRSYDHPICNYANNLNQNATYRIKAQCTEPTDESGWVTSASEPIDCK